MVKTILEDMRRYANETDAEDKVEPTLKSVEVMVAHQVEQVNVSKLGVLLDGGARHNVYYSAKIPKGAIEKEVELAHGTKVGYVNDGDITFVDSTVAYGQGELPSILSLGRLIQYGAKMFWSQKGAF